MAALTGVDIKEPPLPATAALLQPLTTYTGRYESFDSVIDIRLAEGALEAHIFPKIDPIPPHTLTLVPINETCFGTLSSDGERRGNMVFVTEQGGERPGYVFQMGDMGLGYYRQA